MVKNEQVLSEVQGAQLRSVTGLVVNASGLMNDDLLPAGQRVRPLKPRRGDSSEEDGSGDESLTEDG